MVRLNKTRVEFDLANIKDFHVVINDAAGGIIADIKQGVNQGKDVDGKGFRPLSPQYAKDKAAAGFGDKPILVRGDSSQHEMVAGVYLKDRATPGGLKAVISMARDTLDRGIKHNYGIDVPVREWFGVGTRAQVKLRRLIEEKIKGLLRA